MRFGASLWAKPDQLVDFLKQNAKHYQNTQEYLEGSNWFLRSIGSTNLNLTILCDNQTWLWNPGKLEVYVN